MKQGTERTRQEIENDLRKLLDALSKYEDNFSDWHRQVLLEAIALDVSELIEQPPCVQAVLPLAIANSLSV